MKRDANRNSVNEILGRLKKEYPAPKTALHYKTPFELLAATILSAQTTDANVNRVTEKLFKKYRSISAFASAPLDELKSDIKSINFFNTKAKNIKSAAGIVISKFNSKVPKSMEELITLPGVARKTANIVLSEAYGITEGIAVDTHVRRLSNLLGLTKNTDPVKIEQDLMANTPKDEWSNISILLILHGRNVCKAKRPEHNRCVLFDLCPSRNI